MKKMISFNVNKYNEEIELLNETIDTLNHVIELIYDWYYVIPYDFMKDMIYNPAKMRNEYLNYNECVDSECLHHDITIREFYSPQHKDKFDEFTNRMKNLHIAFNKLEELSPYATKAFGHLFYIEREENPDYKGSEGEFEPDATKTRNAELYIMQRCAEYVEIEEQD